MNNFNHLTDAESFKKMILREQNEDKYEQKDKRKFLRVNIIKNTMGFFLNAIIAS